MKTTSSPSTLVFFFFFFCFCALFIHSSSLSGSSPDDPECVLKFDRNPYHPSGDCIGPHPKKLNYWKSISSTLCCRNALTFFSQALALRARNSTDGNIFVPESLWKNCIGPFHRQKSVSAHSCGFDNLFQGNSPCSSLSLSTISSRKEFQDALDKCSRFNSSFDDTCGNCTGALVVARDNLLKDLKVRSDDNEKAICVVAVVVSIAAANLDDYSSVDDLFNCLNALDVYDPGYVRLKDSVAKAIIAACIAVATLMVVTVTLIKCVGKRKRKSAKRILLKPSKEITNTWSGLYRFSKAEIEMAINYADEKRSLGRGSAGQVYKGVLPSGQAVAIKHIYKSNTSDSFTREVEGLSRVRHPNLVCLFGCCIEGGEHYLVYEYCSAGNLAQHLLRKDSVLTWERRVKILRDCALGLRYLHHYIDGCIVHRDIKLTNILLTEDLDPKLSDFGLAKMLGMEESKVFTDVRGTIGYMDPEYMSNAKLTCASDIYSFGIVALQLLSGQKVIELDLDARDQLTRKAKDVIMGKRPSTDFQDLRLNGNIIRQDFESILQIAVLCVAKSSKGRPTVDIVFDEIEKAWKNTKAEMDTKKEMMGTSIATPSRSLEVIPV
ncbi:hypothetical protein Ddye_025904 [Dipteronia dyeriana]|uniref:non-specific serine/threonine protein kinase n=1 Tax=Dipteronia dyeriana TaxID=168575 RepID=A0AAD9TL53_9ROSI|nr:hypothetical protein Ddye_025904 [Dipteronia dyeriana]